MILETFLGRLKWTRTWSQRQILLAELRKESIEERNAMCERRRRLLKSIERRLKREHPGTIENA
jgi:hypothetical protein